MTPVKKIMMLGGSFIGLLAIMGLFSITQAQTSPTEESLLAQIEQFGFSDDYQVKDLIIEGEWAVGQIIDESYGVIDFIAKWDGTQWQIGYEPSELFFTWLDELPIHLLPPDYTGWPFEQEEVDISTPSGFPFCRPTSNIMTQGPHGHNAIDLAYTPVQPPGVTPIYAPYDGVVVYRGIYEPSSTANAFDHATAINHGLINGKHVLSMYVHLGTGGYNTGQPPVSFIQVNVGQTVQKGQLIGYQGNAGVSTGVHVHWLVAERASTPFLNHYTTWGTCGATDLWRELGAPACGTPEITVDPQTYVGAFPIGQTFSETCSQYYDVTAPTIQHSLSGTAGQNGWYVSNVQVNLSAQDSQSGVKNIQYRINGGAWNPVSGASAQVTISNDGQTTVEYRAEDNADNPSGVQSTTFSIDKTAPTSSASITTGTAGQNGWYTSDVQLSQTGSDPAGGSGFQHLRYRIGTGDWQTVANTSTSFSVSSEGQTTVQYQAVDNAGNTNTKILEVKIDKTNPTLNSAVLNNNSPETSNINILVGSTASDAHSGLWQIRFSNDNVNWGAWQGYSTKTAWSIPATNQQSHTLYTQVRDASGHTSTTASDAIVLNLYPARPASNRYSLCASSFSTSGQANMQSTSYRLTSSIGGNVGGASSGNSTTNAQSGFLAAVQACRALGANAQWSIYLPLVRR